MIAGPQIETTRRVWMDDRYGSCPFRKYHPEVALLYRRAQCRLLARSGSSDRVERTSFTRQLCLKCRHFA
jgi:hypothetical protein